MQWKSNSLADIDSFCNYVSEQCRNIGRDDWGQDIQQFTHHAFIRQSEYVDELRSLQHVFNDMLNSQEHLSPSLVDEIEVAVKALDRIIQDNIV